MATELGFTGLFTPDQARLRVVNEDRKVRVGMLFYTCNDIILAIFFFGSYVFLRGYNTNGRWFPPGTSQPPYGFGTWVMVVVVLGGIAYAAGEWALHHGQQTIFRALMVVALLLFLLDMVLQVVLMAHLPFTQASGSFASAYLLLSGYHIYHLAIALFLGAGVVNRALRGRYVPMGAHPAQAHGGAPRSAESAAGGDSFVLERRADADVEMAEHEPAEMPTLNTTGIACIGYYWLWASIYGLAFWLLLIIQPPNLR
ncbi:MAG TPA: hypothetical protein VGN32_21360 [Ktedonobacterales bacterium]|nr:hypothetical protein [Ktedonobacterales bacterium]